MNSDFGIALAFVSGILGAFHCIGMCCGVNAGFFAACRQPPGIAQLAAFHTMRIATYAVLGIGGALLGRVLATTGIVGKTQGLLMMLAGVIVLLLGLRFAASIDRNDSRQTQSPAVPFYPRLPEKMTPLPPLVGGLINGLVPCSLVFSVALQAAATASPLKAGMLMIAFGAGTLPAMVTLSIVGATLGYKARGLLAWATAITVVALGLWTLYEGYIMYDVIRGLANW